MIEELMVPIFSESDEYKDYLAVIKGWDHGNTELAVICHEIVEDLPIFDALVQAHYDGKFDLNWYNDESRMYHRTYRLNIARCLHVLYAKHTHKRLKFKAPK